MKRSLALLLACCVLALPLLGRAEIPDKPDSFRYVYDEAGVLTPAQEELIADYGARLSLTTQATAVLLTVNFLDGMTARDYANDVLNSWGIGDQSRDDGVLLLLSAGDREVAVEPGTGLDRTLTVSVADDLIDGVIDDLANDRFGEGMTRLYQATCEHLASAMGKRLAGPAAAAVAVRETAKPAVVEKNADKEFAWGNFFISIAGMLAIMWFIVKLFQASLSLMGPNHTAYRPSRDRHSGGSGSYGGGSSVNSGRSSSYSGSSSVSSGRSSSYSGSSSVNSGRNSSYSGSTSGSQGSSSTRSSGSFSGGSSHSFGGSTSNGSKSASSSSSSRGASSTRGSGSFGGGSARGGGGSSRSFGGSTSSGSKSASSSSSSRGASGTRGSGSFGGGSARGGGGSSRKF